MSEKPDDIPQEVWDKAERIWLDDRDSPEDISRAIMTAKAEEREKAAAYIDARAADLRKNGNVTSMTVATIFEAEANAIRHRG